MARYQLYDVKDNKITRKKKFCPRCGDGIFLAEHKDRFSCGACGYSEWKKESKEPEQKSE
jgi:small subunit ribosomal protein S27Ae